MKRKRITSKIIVVIVCLSIVLILFVVPCFANSIGPSTSAYGAYAPLDWEGVPLNFNYGVNYTTNIGLLNKFYASDVLGRYYSFYTSEVLSSSENLYNPPRLRQIGNYNDSVIGLSNQFTNGDTLGDYSVNDTFYIKDMLLYDDEGRYLKDSFYMDIVVPILLFNDYFENYIDNIFSMTWTASFDGYQLNGSNPYWNTHSNVSIKYGMPSSSGTSPNQKSMNDLNWSAGYTEASITGFMHVKCEIPIDDFLSMFCEYYDSEYNDCLVFKNLKISYSVDYDVTYIENLLDETVLTFDGSEHFVDDYINVLNRTYAPGRDRITIPCHAVYTHKQVLYDNPTDLAVEFLSNYVTIDEPVVLPDNFLSWLGTTIGGVLDVDILGSISIGDILYVAIGCGFVLLILKFFAGG